MFGRFIQLTKTAVQRAPMLKASTPSIMPMRSVQLYLLSYFSQLTSSLMGLASISNFHIYNLLQVLEKGECLAESESELISSQSTLLAQGISLTNLISTVAKQRPQ